MRDASWYDKAVGERAAHIRMVRSMSATDVAEMLGVTRQSLSNYERGRTPMRAGMIRSLCELYEVPVSWLLGIEDELYYKSMNDGVTVELHETSRRIPSPLSKPL